MNTRDQHVHNREWLSFSPVFAQESARHLTLPVLWREKQEPASNKVKYKQLSEMQATNYSRYACWPIRYLMSIVECRQYADMSPPDEPYESHDFESCVRWSYIIK